MFVSKIVKVGCFARVTAKKVGNVVLRHSVVITTQGQCFEAQSGDSCRLLLSTPTIAVYYIGHFHKSMFNAVLTTSPETGCSANDPFCVECGT